MSEHRLTVLPIENDAFCDPETGVCAVPTREPVDTDHGSDPSSGQESRPAVTSQMRSQVAED